MSTPRLDPEQRSRLLSAKLRVLVEGEWGAGDREPAGFGGGSALVSGDAAWVLVDDPVAAGLGAALAWARQKGTTELAVIVDDADAAGVVARQAAAFADPPAIFVADGRALRPAAPAAAATEVAPPPEALALLPDLEAADVDVVIEHGVISGEVLGLEVARIVVDDGEARIEVGVGRTDREAFTVIHGELPTAEALAAVVDAVRKHPRPDGPAHPLHRLAGERWLRTHLLNDPNRLPGWSLQPAAGTRPRGGVSDVVPAIATGIDDTGRAVVLATSVGIDLDLVPLAADARTMHDPDARLVLAMPARDAHAATRALADRLVAPAELLAIEGDWRR